METNIFKNISSKYKINGIEKMLKSLLDYYIDFINDNIFNKQDFFKYVHGFWEHKIFVQRGSMKKNKQVRINPAEFVDKTWYMWSLKDSKDFKTDDGGKIYNIGYTERDIDVRLKEHQSHYPTKKLVKIIIFKYNEEQNRKTFEKGLVLSKLQEMGIQYDGYGTTTSEFIKLYDTNVMPDILSQIYKNAFNKDIKFIVNNCKYDLN